MIKIASKVYTILNFLIWRTFRDNVKISYSRGGIDLVLLEIFGKQNLGSYIDIGCYDPIYDSNTFKLYQKGWNGIAVDPNKRFQKRFKSFRPKDTFLNNIVSSSVEEVTYYSFQEQGFDQVNTISIEAKELAMKNFGLSKPKELKIKSINLQHLFEKQMKNSKELDLLCIDAEGAELEILSSASWKSYLPKVVVLEVSQKMENLNLEESVLFLIDKGYILNSYITLDITKGNVILIHKDSGLN